MPATPRRLEITAKDLQGAPQNSGGTWSEVEVPGDYELELLDVEDYDKRGEGKSWGWIFHYGVDTSTGPCIFNVYLSFSQGARWKIRDVFKAHTGVGDARIDTFDPNALIGQKIGGHIDFPRDGDDEPTANYREIFEFFPLTELSDVPFTTGVEEDEGGSFVTAEAAVEPEVL